MRHVTRLLIISLLLLLTALPLAAQDTSGHEVALQRIAAARDSQATVLDLSGLRLTEIPAEIGQLTHLRELIADNNMLTEIPAEIGQLTHLRELYADNNALTDVPAEFGRLQNLTHLEMSGNQLTTIPMEILLLSNLERLVLYYNQISAVPNRIGRLTNLTFLGLSGNQLSELPAEIGQLTNLTELHIEINQLASLPAEIGNLSNLCILHLWDNQLTRLPVELGQVTQLAEPRCNEMLIHRNPLVSPPPAVVREGTGAILAYLRGESQNQVHEWVLSGLAMLAVVMLISMGAVITYRSASASERKPKRKRG